MRSTCCFRVPFPALAVAVVTIHMLRGDAGGRAFYIKPREDVQDAHNAAGPLAQLAAAAADSGVGPLDGEATGRRMYFWLSDRDLDGAVHALGRLKSSEPSAESLPARSLPLARSI